MSFIFATQPAPMIFQVLLQYKQGAYFVGGNHKKFGTNLHIPRYLQFIDSDYRLLSCLVKGYLHCISIVLKFSLSFKIERVPLSPNMTIVYGGNYLP